MKPREPGPNHKPTWLRSRLIPMLALTIMTLGLGYWLKARCLEISWHGGNAFRQFCYTDIQALHGSRGWGSDEVPYVEAVNEYPVLTGATAWILSIVFESVRPWWHANAILLLASGVGVTYWLWREGHDWRTATPWLLAPTLALDGFTNWDLWAVFFMVWGLVAFERRRNFIAGLAVGLGAAAKLFPAVVGPALLVVLYNRSRRERVERHIHQWRNVVWLGSGFAVGWLPVNLLFAWLKPQGWWSTYEFHRARGTSFQTPYYLYESYVGKPVFGHLMSVHEFNLVSSLVFLSLMVVVLTTAIRGRSEDTYLLAAGLVAAHIFANKFFSLQYALWLLPLFVLARLPRWLWVTYVTAHAVCFVWANHFRMPPPGAMDGVSGEFIPLLDGGSVVFLTSLLVVIILTVRACWARFRAATPKRQQQVAVSSTAEVQTATAPSTRP